MPGVRTAVSAAVLAVLACAGFLVGAGPATATPGDIGHPGPSFVGAANAPTSDKPQSKLWYADGIWWADMFDTT